MICNRKETVINNISKNEFTKKIYSILILRLTIVLFIKMIFINICVQVLWIAYQMTGVMYH